MRFRDFKKCVAICNVYAIDFKYHLNSCDTLLSLVPSTENYPTKATQGEDSSVSLPSLFLFTTISSITMKRMRKSSQWTSNQMSLSLFLRGRLKQLIEVHFLKMQF